MLTGPEVLARAGVKNARALARYADQGLIDRPTIGPHPSGRGTTSYYPASTVERIREIRGTRKRGAGRVAALNVTGTRRLDRLVEFTFSYHDPIYTDWDFSVTMTTTNGPTPEEKFACAVAWRTFRITESKDVARRAASAAAARDTYESAMRCMQEGFAPVLLLRGKDARVVADVTLAEAMDAAGEGTLAIPLAKVIASIDESAKVRVRPAGNVHVVEDGIVVECGLSVGGPAGVHVVRPDPIMKKKGAT